MTAYASFHFNPVYIAALDDGLDYNDVGFRNTFPYLAQAQSGQEHIHQNPFLSLLLPFLSHVAITVGDLPGGQPAVGWSSLALAAIVVPALVFMRRRKNGNLE